MCVFARACACICVSVCECTLAFLVTESVQSSAQTHKRREHFIVSPPEEIDLTLLQPT